MCTYGRTDDRLIAISPESFCRGVKMRFSAVWPFSYAYFNIKHWTVRPRSWKQTKHLTLTCRHLIIGFPCVKDQLPAGIVTHDGVSARWMTIFCQLLPRGKATNNWKGNKRPQGVLYGTSVSVIMCKPVHHKSCRYRNQGAHHQSSVYVWGVRTKYSLHSSISHASADGPCLFVLWGVYAPGPKIDGTTHDCCISHIT